MNTLRALKTISVFLALLMFSGLTHALLLEPGDADEVGYSTNNCEPGCVETIFETTDLTLLYKAGLGNPDDGSFASSYSTTFSNTENDPSDALIEYIGGDSIVCGECYLAVKDGNHDPSYYFFNITDVWNGTDDLIFQNFWPEGGAISHISIWGGDSVTVPEPGTLALLGLGLIGLGITRKNRKDA